MSQAGSFRNHTIPCMAPIRSGATCCFQTPITTEQGVLQEVVDDELKDKRTITSVIRAAMEIKCWDCSGGQ